jgi:hypothetical protein
MLRFWSLIVFCILFAAGDIAPVQAQAPDGPTVVAQNQGGGLFRSLFGKRRKATRGRDVRRKEAPQTRAGTQKRRTKKRTVRAAPSSPAAPTVSKSEDAKKVLVVGDFMANALAKGLVEAFTSNPDIIVINANNGASGLVRDDYYNWPEAVPKIVAEHEAGLVLVMIGANDRQVIRAPGGRIALNTDAWRTAYEAKVTAFADILATQNVPVIWLSLVPVGSNSLSRDYSGFNSLYRQKAELKGLTFADVWNGFADDKGGYVASGPDINGQNRQLRTGDGLNFTRAGRRKLGFFVEREITRLLNNGQAPVFAGLGGAQTDPSAPDLTPSLPAIGPMVPIDMLAVQPGSDLSTAPESRETQVAAKDEETAEKKPAAAAAPPAGRADNFTWPAAQ